MAKCSRCGREMGNAAQCPACGFGPSQSIVGKSVDKVAKTTGVVLEKGVRVTEEIVQEAKPAVRAVAKTTKSGLSKVKKKTLEVAKDLKD
jgi:hypothetical protein